jgi:hypothetical protein
LAVFACDGSISFHLPLTQTRPPIIVLMVGGSFLLRRTIGSECFGSH